jgi:hypothetical protein
MRTMSIKTQREGRMTEPSYHPEWFTAAAPPPAYTIVMLSFEDGSVRRGVWNGKMWWGYDDRVKRACELHPLRWRVWRESSAVVTPARVLQHR